MKGRSGGLTRALGFCFGDFRRAFSACSPSAAALQVDQSELDSQSS